jgi:hypothetical protein
MTVFRDLSQHLMDIAENSSAAGATLLNINIEEDPATNRLVVEVRDNGRGMDPEMLLRVTDPWVTTRTTRKVGLGIPFLKQAAEMCGGTFEITSLRGEGTVTRAAFERDHIDRPPLGDLAGTLLCIIVGNAALDVRYRHCVGAEEAVFDTRELREVLGPEVPLHDPEILGFIRGTLAESLAILGSEAV